MPWPSAFKSSEDRQLVWFVGDSKARLEPDLIPEFAEQVGAERVNRPTLHPLTMGTQLDEPRSDFAGGSVRKRKSADPRRIEATPVNQKANALDQAKRLPCPRTGKYQQRSCISFYRRTL